MSEIQRYKMEFAPGSGGWIKQTARGELVLFTDHEAAIEQVLADAKARIEGNLDEYPGTDSPYRSGYMAARRAALAALTQPQTERCPEDCDGFGRLIGDSDGPCPACSGLESDGGGAATAADADLELPLTDSTLVEEVVAAVYEACLDRAMDDPDAIEVAAVLRGELTGTRAATEPGPYAKAFRERVCPVPEFPGIEKEES